MATIVNIPDNNPSLVAFGFKEIGPYYWVGNCTNGVEYFAGQTFRTPAEGALKRIKIFPSVVYGSSDATLTIYSFDVANLSWKEKRAEVTRRITKANENRWIEFEIPNLFVNKDGYYAFKISCKGGGMVAIAECPWSITNPYADGVEWVGSSSNEGAFHKDFDIAFEGEIEPLTKPKFI